MDELVNNQLQDLKKEKNIQFNRTIMSHEKSVVGRGICINSPGEVNLLKQLNRNKISYFTFSVWLKHNCQNNSYIFAMPLVWLSCDTLGDDIIVHYQRNIYIVKAPSNIWFHLVIAVRFDMLSIYINGLKREYEKKSSTTMDNVNGLIILSLNKTICLDELLLSMERDKWKNNDDFLHLFQFYIPGKFSSL